MYISTHKRLLAVLSGILLLTGALRAQSLRDGALDTLSSRIHFRVGSAVLDEGFRDNAQVLRTFVRDVNRILADPAMKVHAVTVETGASPEGGAEYNERLAMDRARSVRKYLVDNLPLSASQIKAYSVGADWEGLAVAVRESGCPWKKQVLSIISDTGVRVNPGAKAHDECTARLKRLDGGKAWQWMLENIFEELRQGAGTLRCIVSGGNIVYGQSTRDTLVIIHEYEGPDAEWYLSQASKRASDSSTAAVLDRLDRKPRKSRIDSLLRVPVVAFRTNVLVPLMNVGVEVPVGNRWSVAADWYYPWSWRPWTNSVWEPQSTCFQLLGGSVEGRWWFGPAHKDKDEYRKYRLTGHSLGLLLEGGYYDFQRNWTGRQGEYGAVGIDYMFALPVAKGKIHLEFDVAVGWAFTAWRGYQVHETGGKLIGNYEDSSWNGPVPMRLGVNVVIPIFKKEDKEGSK